MAKLVYLKSWCVLIVIFSLAGCVPAYDNNQDINIGWEEFAWGESEKIVVEKLSLNNANSTQFGEFSTIIKSGLVRTLADIKVNAQPIISANKLIGVILLRTKPIDKHAEITDITSLFTQKYGRPEVNAKSSSWKYKDMTLQLTPNGTSYLVIIINIKQAEAAIRKIVEPN